MATNRTRKSLSITIDPEIKRRVESLADNTGLTISKLFERAMADRIDAYESDPGELLRKKPEMQ